jgi:hypothetical protein
VELPLLSPPPGALVPVPPPEVSLPAGFFALFEDLWWLDFFVDAVASFDAPDFAPLDPVDPLSMLPLPIDPLPVDSLPVDSLPVDPLPVDPLPVVVPLFAPCPQAGAARASAATTATFRMSPCMPAPLTRQPCRCTYDAHRSRRRTGSLLPARRAVAGLTCALLLT